MVITLKGRVASKGKAEGDALVSHELVSFSWLNARARIAFAWILLSARELDLKELVRRF